MKSYQFVSITVRGRTWREVKRLYAVAGINPKYVHRYDPDDTCPIVLVPTDESKELLRLLNEGNWKFRVEERRKYDEHDFEMTPFSRLSLDMAPRGDAGPSYDTQYDLTCGCPRCGTGSPQTSALRIRPSRLRLKLPIAEVGQGETIISEELAQSLFRLIGHTTDLRQCEEQGTHEPVPWWQILPAYTMPPMLPDKSGIVTEEQCPACKQEGFFHGSVIEFTYDMTLEEAKALPPIVGTWERFGHSDIKTPPFRVAPPDILVRNDVRKILKKAAPRLVKSEPVIFRR